MDKLRAVLRWGPLCVVLLATIVLWTLVDRAWFLLPLGYGPRWPWLLLVPIPLLPAGPWLHRLLRSVVTLVVVAWGLLGWRMALPSGNPGEGALRVAYMNVAVRSSAIDTLVREAVEWNADFIVVVECPRRGGAQRPAGYTAARRGEICIWSRGEEVPRITMAPRDPRVIGWSGSIAMVNVDGSTLPAFGVVHLRSVRNELVEFLDVSEVLEQSDSMSGRSTKRTAGSIHASTWFRSLSDPPPVVLGDFNLVPESSRFRADWGYWDDAWEAVGIGTGYTWYSRWFGLRIDRVMTRSPWRTHSIRVGSGGGSDHRSLFVELVPTTTR